MDGSVHRGEWLLARVVQIHRGSDGNGRSSEVRTKALTLVNCASLSMMNSKSVTNWINYSREFAFREL